VPGDRSGLAERGSKRKSDSTANNKNPELRERL